MTSIHHRMARFALTTAAALVTTLAPAAAQAKRPCQAQRRNHRTQRRF